MLAKKAATVDEISNGRLILGLGAGWNRTEYDAYGFAYDHRISRFEEAFTIIRELLATGRCDFDGAYYRLTDCELLPRGPRAGGPPLMVGSTGERMLGITLPHVAAWNAWFASFGNDVDRYRVLHERIDAACRAVGRDPGEVERTVALLVAFPDAVGRQWGYGDDGPVEPIPSDPAILSARLREFADAGVAHVQLVLDPITTDSVATLGPTLAALDG